MRDALHAGIKQASTATAISIAAALANAAGLEDFPRRHANRLDVFEGDISRPGLGISNDAIRSIASSADEVWHAAALLSFRTGHRDDIFRVNVGGTRHILDLVARTRTQRLQHVSTAYVAGTRTGLVLESETDVGQAFRNPYEESKCQAERLIHDAHARGAARASIYRPSVVIGDSVSGRATHSHGVYAFIRGLWRLVGSHRPATRGVTTVPLRILGVMDATLNFVPIDYVADGMIAIAGQAASDGGTYHLANPYPTKNRGWLSIVCTALRVKGIHLVDAESFSERPMTRLEALFHRQMVFYNQYLAGEPRFDCRRALNALTPARIECPRPTVPFLTRMANRYVESLRARSPAAARSRGRTIRHEPR